MHRSVFYIFSDVKVQCYKNLHYIAAETKFTAVEIRKINKEFRSAFSLVAHKQFPDMYYGPVIYNKVVSESTLPLDTFVRYGTFETRWDRGGYWQTFGMVTYERATESGIIERVQEPMVKVNAENRLSWTLCDYNAPIESWITPHSTAPLLIPISFFLKKNGFSNEWDLVTKSILTGVGK
jgi:hypothetical protein